MKIKCVWHKESGKYYTEGEGVLEDVAWKRYSTTQDFAALNYAMLKQNSGKLPGLNTAFTDLALTLECGDVLTVFPIGKFT